MENLSQKLSWNIDFVKASETSHLETKPAIDERDYLFQSFKEFLYTALNDNKDIKKAISVEDLMVQMRQFGGKVQKMLEGENIRQTVHQLDELIKLENEIFLKSIEEMKNSEYRPENSIVRNKLAELTEKKDLLYKMIKKISEEFIHAKEEEIYKDKSTGMTINDIFIDFLVNQCENVDKRLDELRKNIIKSEVKSTGNSPASISSP